PLEMLRDTAGKTIDSHIFFLRQLEKGMKENKRLGRRSIYKECENKSLFISEQEIRTILMNLEKCGMARILKGRGGSVITETGLEVLKQI
ncbi:MAG TPA: Fis family transcriptional regulator, partial [Clostridiaceae bacterium]|nr:Fis family transcriptional regulator [Clostridiaceae bacterium]